MVSVIVFSSVIGMLIIESREYPILQSVAIRYSLPPAVSVGLRHSAETLIPLANFRASLSGPWNSIESGNNDTTWKTLIVLASNVALSGSLQMRGGTRLIGTKNPVKCPLGKQSILSNTDGNVGKGNCVNVISGDIYIENIYFRNIWRSAVAYSNARNLTIKNTLTVEPQ